MTFFALVSVLFTLSQGTPSLQSEGPLAIKNLQIAPSPATVFQPVELTFELTGTWNNPFDPNQVDVTAEVIGANDIFTQIHGVFWQSFEEKAATIVASGPPVWKLRFSPWNIGSYSITLRVSDTLNFTQQKVSLRVNGPAKGAPEANRYLSIPEKKRYFATGKDSFFPIAVEQKASSGPLPDFANLIIVPETLFSLESAGTLGKYNLANAWKLERLLDRARAANQYVLLRLDAADDWLRNPYNKANGGVAETRDEFWTSFAARALYKQKLRYLVSRLNHNPALLGVQFSLSGDVPDYWLQEMANEVYELHPYGIAITSRASSDSVFDLKKLNTVIISASPNLAAEHPGSALVQAMANTWPKVKKPVLISLADGKTLLTSAARGWAWSSLISGAAGVLALESTEELGPLLDFVKKVNWHKREFEQRTVQTGALSNGWGLADTDGAIIYIEAAGAWSGEADAPAGTAGMAVVKGGNYRFEWISVVTGATIANGEIRSINDEVSIPYPTFEAGLACILQRR